MDYKEKYNTILEEKEHLEKRLAEILQKQNKDQHSSSDNANVLKENRLNREKTFLEYLFNCAPNANVITDPDGKITMINKEFTKLFGFTPEESLSKDLDNLIVPDKFKNEALEIDKLVLNNHKIRKETVRKDKFSKEIDVSLIATPIIAEDKIIAQLGIYSDISKEKKNKLLQEILFNISTSGMKLDNIEDLYPIIIKEFGKIWDTKNLYVALHNKDSATFSLPFFIDEKDKFNEIPANKTLTGMVIKNNRSVLLKEADMTVLENEGEIDLIGSPCKVWMGVPLKVEEKTIGVICLQDYHNENTFSQEDLSILEFIANQIAIAIQRRMILDNLIQARHEAEEAAQDKQMFVSTMSHEIRTPLNEVIGITNLLLQGNPREDQIEYFKTLKFSGNHLLTLVNDILDYNRMESGVIAFEQTQFNFTSFLEEIKRSYLLRSKEKNIKFEILKEGNIPEEIIGDPIRLNQILSNLLSNAFKFTKEGSVIIRIKESERKENLSKIEFTVTDTGIGIPKEMQSSIFNLFTQATVSTTRQYGGTGLGLAICKKLIELQGGTIQLESEPGKGSIFKFIIPIGITDKRSSDKVSESTGSFTGLIGKKILVAEDNRINFFVANKFLTGWGVIVSHAENGKIAIDMIEKENFDLILMDLHMPVMDGIEASRIIRNSDNIKIRNIPIVALTAAIMSESHDKIEDLNINDYVLKPFKPNDLYERIAKHIK